MNEAPMLLPCNTTGRSDAITVCAMEPAWGASTMVSTADYLADFAANSADGSHQGKVATSPDGRARDVSADDVF